MAVLTAPQIMMLRLKLDDRAKPEFLMDSDIQAIWDAAEANEIRFMLDAIDIILAVVVKQNDFTQNATTERKGQLTDNYLKLRAVWQKKKDDADAETTATNQVIMVGIRQLPKRQKDRP